MKKYLLINILLLTSFLAQSQNIWTKKTGVSSGNARWALVSFTLSGKGYIGTGYNGSSSVSDFWSYDPINDSWSQVASYPSARHNAMCFVIDNKAYVGGGMVNGNYSNMKSDFYSYNTSSNTWKAISSLPAGLCAGSGFTSNGYGYVVLGWNGSINVHSIYRYDPINDAWNSRTDFPGAVRTTATCFSKGSTAYIGNGFDGSTSYKDFYCYNTDSDVWHRVYDYPAGGTYGTQSFVLGDKAFVVGGTNNTIVRNALYEFDFKTENWTQKSNYGGSGHYQGTAFSIGSRGYSGLGYDGSAKYSGWYMYETLARDIHADSLYSKSLCAGASDTAYITVDNIFNASNKFTVYVSNDNFATKHNVGSLNAADEGRYSIPVTINIPGNITGSDSFQFRVESTNPVLQSKPSTYYNITRIRTTINATRDSFCNGDSSVVFMSARTSGVSFQWSVNGLSNNVTDTFITVYNTSNVTVDLNDIGGCKTTRSYSIKLSPSPDATIVTLRDSICDGDSIYLRAINNQSGEQNKWTKDGNVLTGVTSNNIYVKISGNYQLTKSNSYSCKDVSVTKSIVFMPQPNPSIYKIQDTACNGDSIALTSINNQNGTQIAWYLNGSPIAGITATSWHTRQSGSYKLKQTTDFGCSQMSAPVNLVFLVVGKPSITLAGKSLLASSSPNYQWYLDGKIITGETSQVIVPTQNGLYSVKVSNPFGCGALSDPYAVNFIGINNPTINSSNYIYPNPTNNFITIELEESINSGNVEIINALGEVSNIGKMTGNIGTFSVGMYTPGIYVIRISETNNTILLKKLVIE